MTEPTPPSEARQICWVFFVTPEPQAGELLALHHQVIRSLCTPVSVWLTRRHITYLMLCQAQTCLQEGSSLHSCKYSPWAASWPSNSSCGVPQVARQATASHQAGAICCWVKQLLLKSSWENSIWAMELQAGDLLCTSGWGNNNWGTGEWVSSKEREQARETGRGAGEEGSSRKGGSKPE